MRVTLSQDRKEITVTLPISPHTSKSGKTVVIATTNGNKPTELTYDGRIIYVGLNAYIGKGE